MRPKLNQTASETVSETKHKQLVDKKKSDRFFTQKMESFKNGRTPI